MKPVDREGYVERYEGRLAQFGYSAQTLGWGKPGREHVRFGVISDLAEEVAATSVLDVGCGFADLYEHLSNVGWEGEYHGIDLVPGLLDVARRRHPGLALELADICEFRRGHTGQFDLVVASGIFNWKLVAGDNDEHITNCVRRMFELSRVAVSVDFMSIYVDFQHPDAWHTDPAWTISLARALSKRFRLRHDYMPFEFALAIFRNDPHVDSVFPDPKERPFPRTESA